MSQHDDSQQHTTKADRESLAKLTVNQTNVHQHKDLEIYVEPRARYQKRVDGGMDESFRIQFVHPLTAGQMREITKMLIAMPEEAAEFGFTVLTKFEFLEPDICDYRFWCAHFHSDRLVATWELWARIHHDICPIYSVDGIRYWFLLKGHGESST